MWRRGCNSSLLFFLMLAASKFLAQHQHPVQEDSLHVVHDETPGSAMSHAFSLNLPMRRNGSGTGWLPDSTPMYGYMLHRKKWMFMFHGNMFIRYTRTDIFNAGKRGADKGDAINWFMAMGQRRVGKRGLFRFSSMLSFDALFGGNGYPLLYQTGEAWKGRPLVDRQHPHDLFSELSVSYAHALNAETDVFVYFGYPGEPALGSVAFMHRVSAMYGPDAPLSHHWNDGTHITFGVVTAGLRYRKFKLDVSDFTGREPDEQRYNFDRPRFDSYSARLSFNPNAFWSLQCSQGFVKSPEELKSEENVWRSTVSAVYSRPLLNGNFFNATALWGLNRSHADEQAFLLEGAYVRKRFSFFSRYEFVQKSSEELDLNEADFEHDLLFSIQAFSFGSAYTLYQSAKGRMDLGGQMTLYYSDVRVQALYGRRPLSAQVYLRFYPPRMR